MSEDKAKKSEADAVPFDLPLSAEARAARQNIYSILGVTAAVFMVVAASPRGVWDPLSFIACGYVVFVFCLQNTFIEWPQVGIWELLLLGAALEVLAAPTILEFFGVWQHLAFRLVAWAFDMLVMIACYCHLVRGPCWELPAGSLDGRTCVVTGCNAGIGFETANALARAGSRVIFACRNEDKARAAMQKILLDSGDIVKESQLQFLRLDVSSLDSVRGFAEELQRRKIIVQTLVLNAGAMLGSRMLSVDGFEMTMASNHFGHFLLVQCLLPGLLAAEQRGEKPRIVVVGSILSFRCDRFDWSEVVKVTEEAKATFMKKPYSLFRAYEQSKLANLLFTTELARRLHHKKSKLLANAVHPGEALTDFAKDIHPMLLPAVNLFRPLILFFIKDIRQGSISTVHAATAPNLASGQFLVRQQPATLTRLARDEGLAARFWDRSMELTGAPHVL